MGHPVEIAVTELETIEVLTPRMFVDAEHRVAGADHPPPHTVGDLVLDELETEDPAVPVHRLIEIPHGHVHVVEVSDSHVCLRHCKQQRNSLFSARFRSIPNPKPQFGGSAP